MNDNAFAVPDLVATRQPQYDVLEFSLSLRHPCVPCFHFEAAWEDNMIDSNPESRPATLQPSSYISLATGTSSKRPNGLVV